jgi:hypothetical protein
VPFDYGENFTPSSKTKPVAILNKKKITFADFEFFEEEELQKNKRNQLNEDWAGDKTGLTVPEFAVLRKVQFDQSQGVRKSLSQVAIFVPVQRRSTFYILNHIGITGLPSISFTYLPPFLHFAGGFGQSASEGRLKCEERKKTQPP